MEKKPEIIREKLKNKIIRHTSPVDFLKQKMKKERKRSIMVE